MGLLLAKTLGLMLVAAACGAWFAYWWFRRNYQDVTLEYTHWREEWDAWRHAFEERLAARPPADLTPLSEQVAAVDAAVRDIHIPKPPDLAPVLSAVAAIPLPQRVDLNPVLSRLESVEKRLGELLLREPADLEPVLGQLAVLQSRLDGRHAAPAAAPAPAQASAEAEPAAAPTATDDVAEILTLTAPDEPPAVSVREGSRNLLSHAGHGRPDDLTRIKGVKRVMERTLHDVGVFYFWQIAEWSPQDVEHMHDILPEFKGRIERDEWVEQAGELAGEPDAAPPPEHYGDEY
jgi:predicted flap endonuclease-1-like 5' DNA nuclease